MFKNNFKTKNGYTIIETMIAISLFLIIIMAGMGVLLNANLLHQKSRDMRSIMDNLNFVMDDISRNLRTGHDYVCVDEGTVGCGGIDFKNQDGNSESYYAGENNGNWGIYKINEEGVEVPLTPGDINITEKYPFIISGVDSGDFKQPFVTIKLSGEIEYKNVKTPFTLQTSVSQRLIDIETGT